MLVHPVKATDIGYDHHVNVSSHQYIKPSLLHCVGGPKLGQATYGIKAHISPTMKPCSALSQEASADASSSSPCLRTRAPRIDFPESRCRWHIDLNSVNSVKIRVVEKGGGGAVSNYAGGPR